MIKPGKDMLLTIVFILIGFIWSVLKYDLTYTTADGHSLALGSTVIFPLIVSFAAIIEHPDVTLYIVSFRLV